MTMKTKRTLAAGGGTIVCAALAALITTRFAPEPETVAPSIPEANSTPSVSVQISVAEPEESKPIETNNPNTSEREKQPTDSEIEDEIKNFIDNGGIEVEQNFPEPEKKPASNTSQTDNTTPTDNTPPAEPPKVTDEKMLTDPTKEPTYENDQTTVTPPETPADSNANPAMHGQKKDGMIYINGFGWVADEGGGGVGEHDSEMRENGNKIGYFG